MNYPLIVLIRIKQLPLEKNIFAADEAGYGNELWATDGSLTGTYLVKDISPGTNSTVLSNFVEHKGLLYFSPMVAYQEKNCGDQMELLPAPILSKM